MDMNLVILILLLLTVALDGLGCGGSSSGIEGVVCKVEEEGEG